MKLLTSLFILASLFVSFTAALATEQSYSLPKESSQKCTESKECTSVLFGCAWKAVNKKNTKAMALGFKKEFGIGQNDLECEESFNLLPQPRANCINQQCTILKAKK